MTNLECYELAEADYRHNAALFTGSGEQAYAAFWTGLAQHCAKMAALIRTKGNDERMPF